MSNIKITILMPAYNASKYIAEAISSVLRQTFADFELLIINDGSSDNTEEIIRSFNDQRIVVINQSHLGIAVALNKGLEIAKADLIARFDADDICYADRLELQYQFMSEHKDYIITGSATDYIDMNGEFVFSFNPPGQTNEEIQQLDYRICPFIHSSVCYKKQVIRSAGGYNSNALGFEDHLLWLNILKAGKALNFSKSLLKVRLNPESVTIDEKWRGQKFIEIKKRALQKREISITESKELNQILQEQETIRIKEGSYYALLGKKYLWNNFQPQKARKNIRKTLSVNPFDVRSYFLLLFSYLPSVVIQKCYTVVNAKK